MVKNKTGKEAKSCPASGCSGRPREQLASPPQVIPLVRREGAPGAPSGRDDAIVVLGAGEHNLANVNLRIPRDAFTVFVGVSGSGKSTMAMDVICSEGQRRYVEALSPRLRQFVGGGGGRRKVKQIYGLTPTVGVRADDWSPGSRSTVGTLTEIADLMRLMYARAGRRHCHRCGSPVTPVEPGSIVSSLRELAPGTRFIILAPVMDDYGTPEALEGMAGDFLGRGFTRARVGGRWLDLASSTPHDYQRLFGPDRPVPNGSEDGEARGEGAVDLVIDRLIMRAGMEERLYDSVETALRVGKGRMILHLPDGSGGAGDRAPGTPEDVRFAEVPVCPRCQLELSPLTPGMFSPNTPEGACPSCGGSGSGGGAEEEGGDVWTLVPCPECEGTGLGPEPRGVRVLGLPVVEFLSLPVGRLHPLLAGELEALESGGAPRSDRAPLTPVEATVVGELLGEIQYKLGFLNQVGLSYLTVKRRVNTLATGELQRLRLAAHLGGPLAGLTYVLDEPASGLHHQDVKLLVQALHRLRDRGNTVIAVEHDPQVIGAADHVVEFGPGAGKDGGRIIYEGDYGGYVASRVNPRFAPWLHGEQEPVRRRETGRQGWLVGRGVGTHNLKDVNVSIPMGCLVGVCGVSGSGKSALIMDSVVPGLKQLDPGGAPPRGVHGRPRWGWSEAPSGPLKDGPSPFGRVLVVERQARSRSGRSNPATFIGAYNHIRALYSQLPESRTFGFGPERFSFNVKGGRCPVCKGEGRVKVVMQYMPDMWVTCSVCDGKRFNQATLRVLYRGLNISEVLELTFDEAQGVFASVGNLASILQWPVAAGLGYLRLGQPLNTLSSGEMQRLRLAVELGKGQRSGVPVLYVLDEPTAGLHPVDVARLLKVLDELVDGGNTVLLADHDLQTLWHGDWLIELGPGPGGEGGTIMASGTPEQMAANPASPTGAAFSR